MTTRWPSGYLSAVSRISCQQHAPSRLIVSSSIVLYRTSQTRQYAKSRPKKPPPPPQAKQFRRDAVASSGPAPGKALPQPDAVKSAYEIVAADATHDPINPPRSTLPPRLDLPTRGSESVFVYYFNLGRAYGRFYKDGIKAVWYNNKAARALRKRILADLGVNTRDANGMRTLIEQVRLTRSDFQLIRRNDHDIGKLPLFGLLVLVFGEWLPLIVPFIPNAVPSTCRIPKQQRQMQEKNEKRRQWAFTLGISEPTAEQWADRKTAQNSSAFTWPMAFDTRYIRHEVQRLRLDQLYHLSCTLGLHKHFWDKLQLPPIVMTGRAIMNRFMYLAQDDYLLLNRGRDKSFEVAKRLSPEELRIAVAERGFDVLGHSDEALRERLVWWLDRQAKDRARGRAMLGMLFRRLVIREWVNLNLPADER